MLRVAVIGLGIGEAHLAALLQHPDCDVAGVCDISRKRLDYIQKNYGIARGTTDAHELLSDPAIDAVVIASYDSFHFDQFVEAIDNGKHVFIEKPFCLKEQEAEVIRQRLQSCSELLVSTNLILRESPRVIDLKNRIKAGALGKIYYVEGDYNYGRLSKLTEGWRGALDFYSVVYGGGVHIADLLMWFTDSKILRVSAAGNRICSAGTQFRFNDLVVATLEFENGAIGKLTANFGCVMPHFHQLQIYGTKATFINEREFGLLYTSSGKGSQPQKIETPYPGVDKGALVSNFISVLEGKEKLRVTAEDMFNSMSICFAIEAATQRGDSVEVRYI